MVCFNVSFSFVPDLGLILRIIIIYSVIVFLLSVSLLFRLLLLNKLRKEKEIRRGWHGFNG